MSDIDCVIVGAGVVGLAVAREFAIAGQEVLVIERAEGFGTETSSRNSEVIHAGIYYPENSLKAEMCIKGREMLYRYAAEKAVPHKRCGKLIVATNDEQLSRLDEIKARAARCDVTDLERLAPQQVSDMEPELSCKGALFSPSTGIVDSHALMLSLLGDAENHGAMLSLNTEVLSVSGNPSGYNIKTRDAASGETFEIEAKTLINSAGLWASDLAAKIEGLAEQHIPQTFFARGSYFTLPGRPRFSHLVYPVPEDGGLGVHLTLDMAGGMRFGPDVEWIDDPVYAVNDASRLEFEKKISTYWPGLPATSLEPSYCGIRPKLSPPGSPAADFRIDTKAVHGMEGLVNLFGIESPGLTSSLAIAEKVAKAELSGDTH